MYTNMIAQRFKYYEWIYAEIFKMWNFQKAGDIAWMVRKDSRIPQRAQQLSHLMTLICLAFELEKGCHTRIEKWMSLQEIVS